MNGLANSKAIIPELEGKLDSAPMYWTNAMLKAVRAQNASPLIASRSFAMAHFAGYLALTGDGLGILKGKEIATNVNNELAYGIAFSYALEEALNISLSITRKTFIKHHSNTPHKADSIAWGKSQAKRVTQWRTRDGAQESMAKVYPAEYKKANRPASNQALSWAPTGPFYSAKNGPRYTTFERGYRPAWGQQKTWLIDSVYNFEAISFPDLSTSEFNRQFEKVRSLGSAHSTQRTTEQSEIALFWEDGLMGITIAGHFQLIAMQLLSQPSNQQRYSAKDQAKLFALLSISQADAGIVAWHNKYKTDIIRPETAIRFASSRFKKKSQASDSGWKSYIPTPNFPSYVSGHSVFGAASCSVMANFFGSDKIDLTSPAPDMVNWPEQLKDVRRHYTSLNQISDENGMSREYGGVHWEIDNTEGLRLGKKIAKEIAKTVSQHMNENMSQNKSKG